MKRVITAAVLIPLVLLLLLKGSLILVAFAACLVAALAGWEYCSLADAHGARIPRPLLVITIAALFAAAFRTSTLLLPAVGLDCLAIFLFCGFSSPLERVLPDTAFSIFGLLYCGLALTTLPMIWSQPDGPSLLIFLLLVVWAGDIAALYIGRNFGRLKLSPRISPNKTWEGGAASLAASLLITAALFTLGPKIPGSNLAYPSPLSHWLSFAVVLNVFAQAGDLVESAIKRGAGVKDSGALLPGHGGILDRIDALLLAAPALWYAHSILH